MQSETGDIKNLKTTTLKVKTITKQKRLCKVTFYNGLNLLVSEDELFDYRLYKDQIIQPEVYEKLKEKEEYYLTLDEAIRIVNLRFLTSLQVKNKLLNKNFKLKDINEVINKLKELKVIDDKTYAKDYTRIKIEQGYGPLYIKQKLYELGIKEDIDIPLNKQQTMLEEKYNSGYFKAKDKKGFENKFEKKMIQQGFNKTLIKNIISNNFDYDIEFENISKDYELLYNKYSRKYDGYKLEQTIKTKLYQKGYSSDLINQVTTKGR